MSLAHLLKRGSLRGLATATSATPATGDPFTPPTVATVATVAVAKLQNKAANDPPRPEQTWDEVAPTMGYAAVIQAPRDPDRDCWPQTKAMTSSEIDTFMARLARFAAKGVIHADAEQLTDKLVKRDRELDDRCVCLECLHLAGFGPRSWRCGAWQAAGVAMRSYDAQLPAELVMQLQRCDGFKVHAPCLAS